MQSPCEIEGKNMSIKINDRVVFIRKEPYSTYTEKIFNGDIGTVINVRPSALAAHFYSVSFDKGITVNCLYSNEIEVLKDISVSNTASNTALFDADKAFSISKNNINTEDLFKQINEACLKGLCSLSYTKINYLQRDTITAILRKLKYKVYEIPNGIQIRWDIE